MQYNNFGNISVEKWQDVIDKISQVPLAAVQRTRLQGHGVEAEGTTGTAQARNHVHGNEERELWKGEGCISEE